MVIPFYILYLLFWITGLILHKNHQKAYRKNPFEISAYRLESQSNTKITTKSFHWIKCIKEAWE